MTAIPDNQRCTAHSRAKDTAAGQTALTTLGQLIEAAGDEEQQWAELSRVIDRKSILATREHQRLKDMAGYLPVSDALILFSSVVEAVRRRVGDERISHEIASELERIIASSPAAATVIATRRLAGPPDDLDDESSPSDADDTFDAVAVAPPASSDIAAPSAELTDTGAIESAENTNTGDPSSDRT